MCRERTGTNGAADALRTCQVVGHGLLLGVRKVAHGLLRLLLCWRLRLVAVDLWAHIARRRGGALPVLQHSKVHTVFSRCALMPDSVPPGCQSRQRHAAGTTAHSPTTSLTSVWERPTHAVLRHPCPAARDAALLRRADVWQVPKPAPAIVRLPLRCLLLLLRRRRRLLLPLGLRLLRLLRRLPLRLWGEELIEGLLPVRIIFILPDQHLQLHRTASWHHALRRFGSCLRQCL